MWAVKLTDNHPVSYWLLGESELDVAFFFSVPTIIVKELKKITGIADAVFAVYGWSHRTC